MSMTAASKFRSIRNFPELVDYLGDELDWPIETDDFEEMTFEYSAAELGLDEKTAPKFLEIRRLRPLDKDQPWGIFFIRFDDNKLPVVALRRLLSKLVLKKRSTSNTGDRASWHESDLLLISQTGNLGTQSISFAHFAANPEKTDLPILKVLGWDDDDTGLKIDYVIETLREKLIWPDDPTDSDAWRAQWRDAFTLKNREVIQSSKEMAERLGQLALAVRTRLREVLAIESDEGPIHKLMSVFKENLISDLDTDSFSDMYAQTIAYGLLSARIINPKANTADAAHTQIPITNPFLRDLMETFLNVGGRSHSSGVGLDFDELGINEVVDLLDNTNMEAVLRDFGDRNQKEDPVMHFFEGFLQEYDSKIRKDRGVFYTPQPVVSFIVRSVDEQLRTEFELEDGLADTTTWGELAERTADLEIPAGTSPDQAFVQILDPATGTGTFPVEVIDLIYRTMTAKWQAQGSREAQIKELWNDYVPRHLLPRLHGYELMMAPYAIAHMKIGLKLHETGYNFDSIERARIYLTNALEPAHDFSGTFAFAIPALAKESEAVNKIKNNQRFTVVIGNPPYSIRSANLSKGAKLIVEKYKFLRGIRIKERNALQFEKNIQDDYIKFFASIEDTILCSKSGIFGFISNNSFLDSRTFRGMRAHLLESMSALQIIDLHGSGKKSETLGEDENIFDILQGVAITFGTLLKKTTQAKLQHCDLFGRRDEKYEFLKNRGYNECNFSNIQSKAPFYLLIPSSEMHLEYENAISIREIFNKYSSGVKTHRDAFAYAFNLSEMKQRVSDFVNQDISDQELQQEFNLKDSPLWEIKSARMNVQNDNKKINLIAADYRPFDKRILAYHKDIVRSMALPTMQHMLGGDNLALLVCQQQIEKGFRHIFVTRNVSDCCSVSGKSRETTSLFPMKIIKKNDLLDSETNGKLISNMSEVATKAFKSLIPIDAPNASNSVLEYIYALLYSPTYRERYGDHLKNDLPKILIPQSIGAFEELKKLGFELIALHLLEASILDQCNNKFIGNGTCRVEQVSYSDETIWIDKMQTKGFRNVSKKVWDFQIGGYQVCHKWMKDRQNVGGKTPRLGRILTNTEIMHYQRILIAIGETIRVMAEIDETIDTYGGWPDAFIIADA